jgi:hypothetical protein
MDDSRLEIRDSRCGSVVAMESATHSAAKMVLLATPNAFAEQGSTPANLESAVSDFESILL